MATKVCLYRVSYNVHSIEALSSAAAVDSGSMTDGQSMRGSGERVS